MENKVYILFQIRYLVIKGQERGFIDLKGLSPETISQKLKFRIIERGEKQSYDFDQLEERLKEYYFTREILGMALSVVNKETDEESKFAINISKDWPEGLAEDKIIDRQGYIEITKYLEQIGII